MWSISKLFEGRTPSFSANWSLFAVCVSYLTNSYGYHLVWWPSTHACTLVIGPLIESAWPPAWKELPETTLTLMHVLGMIAI